MTNPTFRVSSGLIEPKHILKMKGGSTGAVWVFLWFINRQTSRSGAVLGGAPIVTRKIAEECGLHPRTVRRYFELLRSGGYLTTTRTPQGFRVIVINQKKFPSDDIHSHAQNDRPEEVIHSSGERSDCPLMSERMASRGHSKIKTPEETPEEQQQQLEAYTNGSGVLSVGISRHCTYCGATEQQTGMVHEQDHFWPRRAGGTGSPDNLVLACHVCNQAKSGRLFESIESARRWLHNAFWTSGRARWIQHRKIAFGGQPPALLVSRSTESSRPCSRCGGAGASGQPWLCAGCNAFYRDLLREAGQGVPEVLR